jgi:hypothetical protein
VGGVGGVIESSRKRLDFPPMTGHNDDDDYDEGIMM